MNISNVLYNHTLWLKQDTAGIRADLREADLRGANLRGANLSEADLRGANLDFASYPLWCGGLNVKADDRLIAQIALILGSFDTEYCSSAVQEQVEAFRKTALSVLFTKYRDDIPVNY